MEWGGGRIVEWGGGRVSGVGRRQGQFGKLSPQRYPQISP